MSSLLPQAVQVALLPDEDITLLYRLKSDIDASGSDNIRCGRKLADRLVELIWHRTCNTILNDIWQCFNESHVRVQKACVAELVRKWQDALYIDDSRIPDLRAEIFTAIQKIIPSITSEALNQHCMQVRDALLNPLIDEHRATKRVRRRTSKDVAVFFATRAYFIHGLDSNRGYEEFGNDEDENEENID